MISIFLSMFHSSFFTHSVKILSHPHASSIVPSKFVLPSRMIIRIIRPIACFFEFLHHVVLLHMEARLGVVITAVGLMSQIHPMALHRLSAPPSSSPQTTRHHASHKEKRGTAKAQSLQHIISELWPMKLCATVIQQLNWQLERQRSADDFFQNPRHWHIHKTRVQKLSDLRTKNCTICAQILSNIC